jgi:hypothetical protein
VAEWPRLLDRVQVFVQCRADVGPIGSIYSSYVLFQPWLSFTGRGSRPMVFIVNVGNRRCVGDDVTCLLVKDDLQGRVPASVRLSGTERPA